MKAYLNDMQGLGSEHSAITKEYKTFDALYRYAIRPFLNSHDRRCKAEIYYGSNIYGKPDKVMSWNRHITKGA